MASKMVSGIPKMPQNNATFPVYSMHFRNLLSIATNIFKWFNLPQSLPTYEIEKRLFLYGRSVIFKHPEFGIVTADGSVYGVNIYNHADKFLYSQPVLGSGNGTVGVSGVCVYNCSPDSDIADGNGGGSVYGDLLKWFARMLADIDVSTTIGILKSRQIDAVVANTEMAKNALTEFYRRLENGDVTVPFAPATMFENVTDLVTRAATGKTTLTELTETKKQVMRLFYATFGVQSVDHKNERMITDEIDSDTDFLAANVQNMLNCRRNAVEQLNKLFNLNVSVGVNSYVNF